MTKTLGVCLVVLTLGCLVFAAAPDFSGNWVLNKDKSNYRMGRDGGTTPDINLTVQQTAESVAVKQQVTSERGTRDSEYTLKTNGTEQEIPGFMGRTSKATAKWDGNILVVDTVSQFEREGEQITIKSNERWELSADGKALTINGKTTTPMGDRESTRVFEKK